MPKLKTHSGAKKRFNLTKTGKVKRAHANKRHSAQRSRQDHQAEERPPRRRLRGQDQRARHQASDPL